MNPWVDPRANNREDRHRLGGSVDASPPVLSEQEQNRGDQSSSVANTHPKHKVNDRPSPEHRAGVSPNPDPFVDQKTDQHQEHRRCQRSHPEKDPPKSRLGIFGHPTDHIGNGRVSLVTGDQRRTPTGHVFRVIDFTWIVRAGYGCHGYLCLSDRVRGLRYARRVHHVQHVQDEPVEFGSPLQAAWANSEFSIDTRFVA